MKNFTKLLYLLLLTGGSGSLLAQQDTAKFTTPGSYQWAVPAGVTSVTVQLWGAGGNLVDESYYVTVLGQQVKFTKYSASGGGGAWVKSTPLTVKGGQICSIAVGKGATAGDSIGGNSSFSYSDIFQTNTVTANGANGWVGGTTSTGLVAQSFAGGNGGAWTSAATAFFGGGGAAAGAGVNGANGGSVVFNPFSTITNGQGGTGALGGGSGATGGQDNAGFPGGGGASLTGSGGNGQVLIIYTCNAAPFAGTIGSNHSITFPPELVPDSIISISNPPPPLGFSKQFSYVWQQTTDTTQPASWVATKTAKSNSAGYRFDQDSLQTTTYYRRAVKACPVLRSSAWSNIVQIKVLTSANGRNGKITGIVETRNGVAKIQGRKVYAQCTTTLKGRTSAYLDSAITDPLGKFIIDSVYYGDKTTGDPATVSFLVYPDTTGGHLYDPPNATFNLSASNPTYDLSSVPFQDTTVLALTGQVYQVCNGCLINGSSNFNDTGTVTAALDSVHVTAIGNHNKNNSEIDSTYTGYLDPPGHYGNYALNFQQPDSYTVKPFLKNNVFVPAKQVVSLISNVGNVNFNDTTTHLISGRFSAGCNDALGTAVLEFDDSLPLGYDGKPRASVFRKQVKTDDSGYYAIRLPARQYKVHVLNNSITVTSDVDKAANTSSSQVQAFFDTLPIGQRYRDITSADATLNLVYQRPPQMQITGLMDGNTHINCPTLTNYAIWPQASKRAVKFITYQGPVSKGCGLASGKIAYKTDIRQLQGRFDTDTLNIINDTTLVRFTAGPPSTLTDPVTNTFSKYLYASVTDQFGRYITTSNISPALPVIVITGVSVDTTAATFVTTTPQIPMLVLHDPPGTGSSSVWSQNTTSQQTMSFQLGASASTSAWTKVKVGVDNFVGLGDVVEVKAYGQIKSTLNCTGTFNNTDQAVISTKATSELKTSDATSGIGQDADVFYGGALNLLYSAGNEVDWDSTNCKFILKPVMIFQPTGITTTYAYTLSEIRDVQIPKLKEAQALATTSQSALFFGNQIKVWEQLLANNAKNQQTAQLDKNLSFSGGATITSSTTTTNTKTNTYQFSVNIDQTIAAEVGVEASGTGVSGGVTVKCQLTTGGTTEQTNTVETTTGYTLTDNNTGSGSDKYGDLFSVNVLKDPVYGTPMFSTVAGESYCPHEAGTVALDSPYLATTVPVLANILKDTANFTFNAGNFSIDPNPKTYTLYLNGESNPDGATINIGGSPAGTSIANGYSLSIPQNAITPINIQVIRNTSSGVYNYDNLSFTLADGCGDVSKSTTISADFASPVSGVNFVAPANSWLANTASANTVPVIFNSYDKGNLSSISLQYDTASGYNWKTVNNFTAAGLNATSTNYNWDISQLLDGGYKLRLVVEKDYSNNTKAFAYSPVVSGVIDRLAPALYGAPEPTTGIYVTGSPISFSYTKTINQLKLNAVSVIIRDQTRGVGIPVSFNSFSNTLVITPSNNLLNFAGDKMMVIVNGITDLNGNQKTTPDTAYFVVSGNNIAADSRVQFIGTNPNVISVTIGTDSVYQNDSRAIDVHFKQNTPAKAPLIIYYNLAGSGSYAVDYKDGYSPAQYHLTVYDSTNKSNTFVPNTTTGISGAQGAIILPQDSTSVTLFIKPLNNPAASENKKVVVSLSPSGDYVIDNQYTVTGTILTTNAALPVQWLNFTAQKGSNSSIVLDWATSYDAKNKYFEVQRSADGLYFAPLGFVNEDNHSGLAGAYTYIDESPVAGLNYYRLKQVDKDGRFSYSKVVTMSISGSAAFWQVYPNPAHNSTSLHINTSLGKMDVQLVTAAGNVVYRNQLSTTIAGQKLDIPLVNLAGGIYFLKVATAKGVQTQKILVK